jgi:hypothetical protein
MVQDNLTRVLLEFLKSVTDLEFVGLRSDAAKYDDKVTYDACVYEFKRRSDAKRNLTNPRQMQ